MRKREELKKPAPQSTPCPFTHGEKRPAGGDAASSSAAPAPEEPEEQREIPGKALEALLGGDITKYTELVNKLTARPMAISLYRKQLKAKLAAQLASAGFGKIAKATCRVGHSLKQTTVKAMAFQCEKCGTRLPTDSIIYGCKVCRYDVCEECANPEDTKETTSDEGGGVKFGWQDKEGIEAKKKEWMKIPPPKGTVRYIFEKEGPLGLRLSSDIPPWVLEVRDGSLAAKKAPRMPLGGIVTAVNTEKLSKDNAAEVVKQLGVRPLALDVEWPADQGKPTAVFA